jgi:hypothetical protein
VLIAAASCSAAPQPAQQAAPPAQKPPPPPPPTAKGTPDISPGEASRIPPMPPSRVSVQKSNGKIVVSWDPSRLAYVTQYRIFRKSAAGTPVAIAVVDKPRFVDDKPPNGNVSYGIAAIGRGGVQGPISDFVSKASPQIKR